MARVLEEASGKLKRLMGMLVERFF